jgi:hypothetical protein
MALTGLGFAAAEYLKNERDMPAMVAALLAISAVLPVALRGVTDVVALGAPGMGADRAADLGGARRRWPAPTGCAASPRYGCCGSATAAARPPPGSVRSCCPRTAWPGTTGTSCRAASPWTRSPS